ncbi:MAG: CocE/NonD family hydrolase C-terminal non-catalytic domain-containing protein [Pseudonocardiaceae bacterium]
MGRSAGPRRPTGRTRLTSESCTSKAMASWSTAPLGRPEPILSVTTQQNPFLSTPHCGGGDPVRRDDVQRYSTPVLAQPLTISGTPTVRLHVSTDQPDTDWVARLLHDDPDDRRTTLSWGYANTGTSGEHTVGIELAPTGATVPPGARLHLEITGSYFPELARSLGGPNRYRDLPEGPTIQTLRRGPATDSRLHLPLADPA